MNQRWFYTKAVNYDVKLDGTWILTHKTGAGPMVIEIRVLLPLTEVAETKIIQLFSRLHRQYQWLLCNRLLLLSEESALLLVLLYYLLIHCRL